MKERCKDLVGKRVRLKRQITTRGGTVFHVGEELVVAATWRGRFTLSVDGETVYTPDARIVSAVRRHNFDVLETEPGSKESARKRAPGSPSPGPEY